MAEVLHYYELAKLVPGGGRRPRFIRWQPISPRLSAVGRDLDAVIGDWRTRMTVPRPAQASGTVRLLPGEIVVGDKLLTDAGSVEVQYVVDTYDKALAVDMESVGAASAALEHADNGHTLSYGVLRGISDWIDQPRNQETRDVWRCYAADAAIAAALGLIVATPSNSGGMTVVEADYARGLQARIHTINIPAGPSRAIRVSYRALSTSQSFAAQATVHETVPAHILLRPSKRPTGLVGFGV